MKKLHKLVTAAVQLELSQHTITAAATTQPNTKAAKKIQSSEKKCFWCVASLLSLLSLLRLFFSFLFFVFVFLVYEFSDPKIVVGDHRAHVVIAKFTPIFQPIGSVWCGMVLCV